MIPIIYVCIDRNICMYIITYSQISLSPPARRGARGRQPRGPGGGGVRTAAVGPGGRGDKIGWGYTVGWRHTKTLYKAPKDYTKPQNTIQRHRTRHKDLKDYTQTQKTRQSNRNTILRPHNIRQRPELLNKSSNTY